MKLVLIRHGQTNANAMIEKGKNIYTGCLNTKLTDLTDDAIKLAKEMSKKDIIKEIDTVYTSDLKRTIDTAKYAKPGFDYTIVKEVRERSLGAFDGKTKEELIKIPEYVKYFNDPNFMEFRMSFTQKAPGGENYTEVMNRCMSFLKTLDYSKDNTVGIFSHLAAIRCMILGILKFEPRDKVFKLNINNLEIIVFEGDSLDNLKLVSHNLDELFM